MVAAFALHESSCSFLRCICFASNELQALDMCPPFCFLSRFAFHFIARLPPTTLVDFAFAFAVELRLLLLQLLCNKLVAVCNFDFASQDRQPVSAQVVVCASFQQPFSQHFVRVGAGTF